MKKTGFLLMMILLCVEAFAQEKKLVRKGNELYQQKKYKEAATAYQQALQKNPTYTPGAFNLGNSLIQQGQLDAARKVMTATAKNAKRSEEKAGANYNIGNTYMAEKKWSEAVDAYKQTLRKNPQDADAKYNLSYALAKMKQDQQKNDKNKDKNKKDNKDQKDKDKQDKGDNKGDKKQDQQGKNDQQKQDPKEQQQDKKDGEGKEDQKEQQRPQPQPSKLSQQQADNLLNALQQDERKLQDKAQKGKGVPVKVEKDW